MPNINETHIKQLWDHTAEYGRKYYNDSSENQHDTLGEKNWWKNVFSVFLNTVGKHIPAVAS